MSKVTLLQDKKIKRLQAKNYEITTFLPNSYGEIVEFEVTLLATTPNVTKKYVYVDRYILDGNEKKGYCDLFYYKQFRNNDMTFVELSKEQYWFDEEFENAQIGDIFEITKIDFYESDGVTRNFTSFYKKYKYAFKINSLAIDFGNSLTYPKPFNVNIDENLPNYSIKIDISPNLLNHISGRFYTKNFGDKVPTLIAQGIKDPELERLAYTVLNISFKIHWMLEDQILDNIAIKERNDLVAALRDNYHYFEGDEANSGNTYNALSKIDKIIVDIFRQWGVGHIGGVPEYLLPVDIFPDINIQQLTTYYETLVNLHNNLFGKEEATLFPPPYSPDENIESQRRYKKLLSLISHLSLRILPIEERLSLLDEAIKSFEIFERDSKRLTEGDVLKIMDSVTGYAEANKLLEYLLETKLDDKVYKTKFELLFRKMDDHYFYHNITIADWFTEHKDNRMAFTFLLYRKWKISKYNFNYVPSSITPNADGLNPESYFLDESVNGGNKYYAKYDVDGNIISGSDPILEFYVEKVDGSGSVYYNPLSTEISYETEDELNKEKITINKIVSETYSYYSPYGGGVNTIDRTEVNGYYHLYQPISLLGYEANLELSIPQAELIPAFLFYYAVDFDELQDIEAGIQFGLEVAVEVGLFFVTGGVSIIADLRYLRYLKYVTKINKARTVGGVAAQEAVLFWRGIEAGAEVTAVTGGIFSSYFSFLANTSNNLELKELNERISYFFLALTFASAGKALYSRKRAVKSADDVLDEIERLSTLPTPIPHQVPQNVLDVIQNVGSKLALQTVTNINKIAVDYPQLGAKLTAIKNTNLRLSSQLTEIIIKREAKTKLKFNTNANFLDNFDTLAKVSKFDSLSQFYDDYYRISQAQRAKKNKDIFSEFSDLVPGQQLHTMDEVLDMINHGATVGVTSKSDLYGLIVKSYRKTKQASSVVVKQWISAYKTFLDTGLPHCFTSVAHFDLFKTQVGDLFSRYKLGDNLTIGGSSLNKIPPPDLDMVLYFDAKKYDALVNHYESVLNELKTYTKKRAITKYDLDIKSIQDALAKSRNGDQLDVRCMIDFKIVNGQPKLNRFRSELASSSSFGSLNVTSPKKYDFNIFKSERGNRAISLPPEFNFNL
ncbi:MAG TPA: hypothetical protein VF676_02225 [Flavobacterium sp.]|jgi:hypothetical protein